MLKIENDPGNNIIKGYSMLLSFAGTFVLHQPQIGCINDLAGSDIFKQLPVQSNNPDFLRASSYLRSLSKDSVIDYGLIMSDHKSLFGNKASSLAPPYESVYVSNNRHLAEGQFEVTKIYESYAWISDSADKVQGDHIGIELQFLILLLEKYHEIEDGICKKELTNDLIKFIEKHLDTWIYSWNQRVQINAGSDFYKGIGFLIISCIKDLSHILNTANFSS